MYGNKIACVVRDLPACDVVGNHSRLACVATRRCWHNSKVIHCTKKYWGTNTTTGKYEPARQFFSVAMQFSPSCLASSCCYSSSSPFSLALPSCLPFAFTLWFTPLTAHCMCSLFIFALLTHYFCC